MPLGEITGAGIISLQPRVEKRLPVADRDAEDSVGTTDLTDQGSSGIEPDTYVLRYMDVDLVDGWQLS